MVMVDSEGILSATKTTCTRKHLLPVRLVLSLGCNPSDVISSWEIPREWNWTKRTMNSYTLQPPLRLTRELCQNISRGQQIVRNKRGQKIAMTRHTHNNTSRTRRSSSDNNENSPLQSSPTRGNDNDGEEDDDDEDDIFGGLDEYDPLA